METHVIDEIINNRYRLEAELGQGGMGTVYLAHDSVLDRQVALKLMSKPRLGTEGRSRLLIEAQTVAKLKHPNIVTVYDAGEVGKQPYVVMEYIQGETLNKVPLDGYEQTIVITRQICAALQYAHEQGIVHRDLKPENVIIGSDGTLRLMDFGLAISTSSRMTDNGLIMGTVAYMSPEQAFGNEVTPVSDLYSLGVILYELTTGSLPFEAEDALAIITQHIHAPVVPPRAKDDGIPASLNDLILSLLNKDPHDRPNSAAEVLALLDDPLLLERDSIADQDFSVLDRIVRGRMIGRQAEFEEALILWRRVVNGQGQALLISGEPGIGKTRLMREIVTNAEVSGGTTLVGECYAESNAPYAAFAQITRQVLNRYPDEDLELPDTVLDDLLDLTPDLRYRFPEVQPNPKLDPESEQQRLFENMVALCTTISNQSPLLLVVDDAHWCDSGILAMLRHLIRRTQNMQVMILVSYREIELKEALPFNEMLLDLNRQRIGTRIKLKRLDRHQTRQMLKAIFAEEVSLEFTEGIYRETDGNPFFIEEICRTLVESGALYFEAGEWHRPSMEELEIPQGVQVAVESRLAKLPKEHREVLRMASILGREFEFEILLAALDLDEDTLIEALETAEGAQMIKEVDGPGEVTFVFVHALVPNAIADSIRTLRRRKFHRRAAKAIELISPEDFESLAYHFGEAGNEQQALKYYTLAGERAAAVFANQDAENHFSSALDLVEEDRDEAYLLTQLGLLQKHQGKMHAALETMQQAIELYESLNESDEVADLYAHSARAAWDSGDTKGALAIARKGLASVEGTPDGPGLAHLLVEISRLCYFNGYQDESREIGLRGLEMAKVLKLSAIQIDALSTLGMQPVNSAQQSIQMLEEAAQLAESENLLRQATRAFNNLGIQYMQLNGDFVKSNHFIQKALDFAIHIGDREKELFFLSNVGFNKLIQGQVKPVEEMLPELERLNGILLDANAGQLGFNQLYAILLVSRGNLDQALEFTKRKMILEHELGDLQRLEGSLLLITEISLITANLDQGEKAALELVQIAETGIASFAGSNSLLSVIYSLKGEVDQARTYYEIAAKDIESPQVTIFGHFWVKWAQAELYIAEQDWKEAWSAFEKLYRFGIEKRLLWHLGIVLQNWTHELLRHCDPEDLVKMKAMLNEGLERFQDTEADGFVKVVKDQLAVLN